MLICRECDKNSDQVKFYKAPNNKRCASCQNKYTAQKTRERKERGGPLIRRSRVAKVREQLTSPGTGAPREITSWGSLPRLKPPTSTQEAATDSPVVAAPVALPVRTEKVIPQVIHTPVEKPVTVAPAPEKPVKVNQNKDQYVRPNENTGIIDTHQKVVLSELYALEKKIYELQTRLTDLYHKRTVIAQGCRHRWVNGLSAATEDTFTEGRIICGICRMYLSSLAPIA